MFNILLAQRDYDGDLEPLGLHVKDALKTISRLQGLGLQRLKIPLPKCIVLGKAFVSHYPYCLDTTD